jgi:putative ABC transport system permease protein
MKNVFLFRLFYREFKKQRKRATLTILGIAWGTFSIVLLLAFGEGLKDQLRLSVKSFGDGIVIVYGGQTSIPFQGMGKGRRIRLIEEDYELLKRKIPEIELITPEIDRTSNTLTYGRKDFTEYVTGVYPDFADMRTNYPDWNSRFINPNDIKYRRRVVFLGSVLKDRLFGDKEAIGETIFINNIPFLIIGIMKEKMQMSNYRAVWDDEVATIPFTTFQSIYGDRYLDHIIYKPKDISRAEMVKQEVFRVLGAKYKFDPKDAQALDFWDTIENLEIMDKVFIGIEAFLGIIGGLTLIVAGVGVANIMYVAAKERTKEIGIKMALGAKRKQIILQFVSEALLISFVGGLVGVFVSVLIVTVIRHIPIEAQGLQFLTKPTISFYIMFVTALILGMIGFLSGIFPARKAASLNPIEALRYE